MSLPLSVAVALLVTFTILIDLWPFFAVVALHRCLNIPRMCWPFLHAAAFAIAFLMPRHANHLLLLAAFFTGCIVFTLRGRRLGGLLPRPARLTVYG